MAHVPVLSSRPMRGFTWRAKQRHRPEVMASTGWKHGFESLKEVRLLVALDFLRASEVLSQPFRLDFEHAGGDAWHIPDFLAVIGGGMWLLDVRPMELIKEEDALVGQVTKDAPDVRAPARDHGVPPVAGGRHAARVPTSGYPGSAL